MIKKLITTTGGILLSSALAWGNYHFQPQDGKVTFATKGWPSLITIKGESKGVQGELVEADGKVSGKLSFDLQTLKTGIQLRDDHMKNKYLEVAKHPKATLTLTALPIPQSGAGDFAVKGKLLVHGVENDVDVTATLEEGSKEGEFALKGEFPIKLSDFNIAIPSYKGITVAETVKVVVESKVFRK